MTEAVALPLPSWETFYVIVGSSAAALTGLMFVVITLLSEKPGRTSGQQISTFGTPTVVHFCFSLLVSTILTAPWQKIIHAGVALGIAGVAGGAYAVVIIRRARRQTGYKPELEDWVWYATLPLLAYLTITVAAIGLHARPDTALFAIGAAAVLLIFVGIHNAWDTVTYVATEQEQRPSDKDEREAKKTPKTSVPLAQSAPP